jgi:methylated-DNA-[protein]-cysteine S-methyltransferase
MPAATRQPTAFESRVYEAIRSIPRGRVASYGSLARHLGCGSAQAVGQALRRNPFAPETPCHRIIAADGRLGGFEGARADAPLAKKRRLLEAEGVRFDAGGGVAAECWFEFGA